MRRRLARLAGQQPLGAAGAVVVAAMIVAAIFAPQLAPYGAKDAAFFKEVKSLKLKRCGCRRLIR